MICDMSPSSDPISGRNSEAVSADLIDFIDASPSPFHAVATAIAGLLAEGYLLVASDPKPWELLSAAVPLVGAASLLNSWPGWRNRMLFAGGIAVGVVAGISSIRNACFGGWGTPWRSGQ